MISTNTLKWGSKYNGYQWDFKPIYKSSCLQRNKRKLPALVNLQYVNHPSIRAHTSYSKAPISQFQL